MADEKKSQGFTIVSNEIFELKIKPISKLVYITLIKYNNKEKGYSYPSQKMLMEDCNLTNKTTLINAINELEEKGIIKKECIKGKGNKYYLTSYECVTSSEYVTSYESVTTPVTKVQQHQLRKCNTTNTNINTNTITNNNMSDSKESDEPPGAFKNDNNNSNKTNENTITTKSKGEKEKEKNSAKKKEKEQQIKEVVEYLNLKANRNYRPGTTKTKSLISARLKDYTVEDLKAVIDFKVGEWLENEKMNKYLRPETLFNETKFENYINELPSQATKKSSQSYLEDNDVELSLDDIIKINLGKTNKE